MGSNPYRLVLFDLDGTITQPKSIWEFIHRSLGLWENGADAYQRRFLEGEISYKEFCLLDAQLWRGMKVSDLHAIVSRAELNPGATEIMGYLKSKGMLLALVSSGLGVLSDRVKDRFGFDFAVANELVIRDGRLTGEVKILVSHDGKGEWIDEIGRRFQVAPERMIAIGDSSGDIAMFRKVGFSVAFNSTSEELKAEARVWVKGPDLRDVIPLLPIR